MEQRGVVWVNSLDPEAAKIQDFLDQGLFVVNAPRPISGDHAWEGRFRSGVFYVAGDVERFASHWRDYGAIEVKVISNAEILAAVKETAKGRAFGDRLPEFLAKNGEAGIFNLANVWLQMPYWVQG